MSGQPSSFIDQFVHYLRFERHFSHYTSRCYGADLRQYAQFLGDDEAADGSDTGSAPLASAAAPALALATDEPRTASESTGAVLISVPTTAAVGRRILAADALSIRSFPAHLDTYSYSPATTARKIATLRSFYKWLHRRGTVPTNPMLLIRDRKS